jgi:hypothetical protein
VATFRVYYSERGSRRGVAGINLYGRAEDYSGETEWEETVEARSESGALEEFFKEHGPRAEDISIVEETGEVRALSGADAFDPDRTYIWIEDGKLMEYQGIDEATPGMVTCPLCEGAGEVDEELAREFLEEYGEEGEGEGEPA